MKQKLRGFKVLAGANAGCLIAGFGSRTAGQDGGHPSSRLEWMIQSHNTRESHLPTLLLPKKRPDFVDDVGGGGFWIWEAVGARDWRMEYVRCMMSRSVEIY